MCVRERERDREREIEREEREREREREMEGGRKGMGEDEKMDGWVNVREIRG